MYCFIDISEVGLVFIDNIPDETCKAIMDSYYATREVLEFYALGKCLADALDEFNNWCQTANFSGNHLMRNLHTAERLARSFLFEFRTCLDHMETSIKETYGENSVQWAIFQKGTSEAYDMCPEYAFTYHLRNYAQHCKSVVHGFNGYNGIGPSCNSKTLMAEYKKWKAIDKSFIQRSGEHIDLLHTFSKAFTAFNSALKPTMQHMLNTNGVGNNIIYLKDWGNTLTKHFHRDVNCFQIARITFSDGTDATKEDRDKNKNIEINAHPLDWDMIYGLASSVIKKPVHKDTHNRSDDRIDTTHIIRPLAAQSPPKQAATGNNT